MAIVRRWDPWGDIAALQRDVSELFNRTLPGTTATARTQANVVPPIDAFRTDEALVVRVDLPGLRPQDVDVSVEEGLLSVSGEWPTKDAEDDAWVRRERPTGYFERSFSLPEGTDAERISAAFNNGVLELRIPHPPERKPHKVQIEAGSSGEQLEAGSNGETVNVGSR